MKAHGLGDGSYSWLLAMLELYVGIMTACMPAMKLFITWIRGEGTKRGESEDMTIGGGRKGRRKRLVIDSKDGNIVTGAEESRESVSMV